MHWEIKLVIWSVQLNYKFHHPLQQTPYHSIFGFWFGLKLAHVMVPGVRGWHVRERKVVFSNFWKHFFFNKSIKKGAINIHNKLQMHCACFQVHACRAESPHNKYSIMQFMNRESWTFPYNVMQWLTKGTKNSSTWLWPSSL